MSTKIVSGKIPCLNGENYGTWRVQMEAILHRGRYLSHAKGEIIRPSDPGPQQIEWDEKDLDARAELILAMEPSIVSSVRNLKTSHDIWKYVAELFEKKGPRQKTEEYRKLINIQMEPGQSAIEHVREFNSIVGRLKELGAKLDEDLLVVLLLDSLSHDYNDVRAAFDAQSKYPELSTVCTRLVEVSERKKEGTNNALSAKFTKHNDRNNRNKGKTKHFPFNCRKCGKYGHKAKDCWSKGEKARKVQTEQNCSEEIGFVVKECVKEIAYHVSENKPKPVWCLDSGATSHMCTSKPSFVHLEPNTNHSLVKLANNQLMETSGKGTVKLDISVNSQIKPVHLYNTLYVPGLSENLISVSKATDNGYSVVFANEKGQVFDKQNKLVVEATKKNGLYIISDQHHALRTTTTQSELGTWHKRMGHLNINSLKQLQSHQMVSGLPSTFKDGSVQCKTCVQAKQTKLPFPSADEKKSSKRLQLVHSDVCGPMRTESLGRAKYLITFIDDFSRSIHVYFIHKKSEALEKFKSFQAFAETQTGEKIKQFRTDNGLEYMNRDFELHLNKCGILHQTTVPHTPEQNGLAERANRTLLDMARCLKLEADLPDMLWAELVSTAAFIRNRCPTRLNGNVTPFELWTGNKPDVSFMREIGTTAYALIKGTNIGKFEKRNREGVLIGYSESTKAYKLWLPGTRTIIRCRDVKFVEGKPTKLSQSFQNNTNKNDNSNTYSYTFQVSAPSGELVNSGEEGTHIADAVETEDKDEDENSDVGDPTFLESADADSNESNNLDETLKPASDAKLASDDPKTLKDIANLENSDEWKNAMKEEYDSLVKNNTWTLVPRPNDRNPIKTKWVFKTKYRPDGTVEKRKARLVAKGFDQVYGLDYHDTYSPVANISTIRLTMAIAVEKNLDMHHMDVSSAYLNGDIDTIIYMEQPEGFVVGENNVCKLNKAIYGLKQSGRQWNLKLDSTLRELGYNPSAYDKCMYHKFLDNKVSIITVYVDDLLIATDNQIEFKTIKRHLMEAFEIRDLGYPEQCVGLEIKRNGSKLLISQPGYVNNILSNYGMQDCKPVRTPVPPGIKLQKEPTITGENEKVNKTKFRGLIGSLQHLSTFSRPDIAFAVNTISQFCEDPRQQHWNTGMHILRYLQGSKNAKLIYRKTGANMHVYADSSWAEDTNDRKSQLGFVFVYGGGAIMWTSKKQRIITTSSTEAEYVTLSSVAKEEIYMRNLLMELRLHEGPMEIYNDCKSAISIANSLGTQGRTKHMDIRHHYIRETIAEGHIRLCFLRSEDLPADALTKQTPSTVHLKNFEYLGMSF